MINFNSIKKKAILLLTFIFFSFLPGCQFLSSLKPWSDDDQSGITTGSSPSQLDSIYIQSITGHRTEIVKKIFLETIKEQNAFSLIELLPDDLSRLGVLRMEILDYSIWENTEPLPEQLKTILNRKNKGTEKEILTSKNSVEINQELNNLPEKNKNILVRRNAIVRIKVVVFAAETGRPLVRKVFQQPFQQIYFTQSDIEQRPGEQVELLRLTKLSVLKIFESLLPIQKTKGLAKAEKGEGHDWISQNLYNFGDRRLKKGNKYAESGKIDKAVWIWKIVLYGSAKEEPKDVYIKNRASAYYNLGLVYNHQGNWLAAANMFSQANRLQQKLKYAQDWGESMQLWLQQQRYPVIKKPENENLKKTVTKTEKEEEVSIEDNMSEIIKNIEQNDQLLLKAKELWPLDPHIKNLN